MNILDLLLGGAQAPSQADPTIIPTHPASPLMPEPSPITPSVVSHDDIAVEGDRWKPHKTTFLGTAADILLGAPVFTNKNKRDNLISAMQGFTDNPLRSIRRVAKLNPDAAWTMYNQYHDNQIQDVIQKRADDNETLQRGLGLLGAANEKNYPVVKQRIEQYWANKHYTSDMPLPDTYDPEAIQGYREGAMKAKEQLDFENQRDYRKTRLDQFQQEILNNREYKGVRLGQFNRTITNTQEYRQQRLQQLQSGHEETERHHKEMEGHSIPSPGARELSPDRTVMREFGRDGQWHIFKKVNGKIQEVGVLAPKSQGGTKYDPEDYDETPVDDEDNEE